MPLCGPKFFESRFHAYMGISWYFTIFVVVNLGLGIWGLAIADDHAVKGISRPGPGAQYDCAPINKFAKLISSTCVVEAVLCALLSFGLLTLVQGYLWALFSVATLLVYGLLIFLKAVAVILGVVWLWGDAMAFCKDAVAPLYSNADLYLKVILIVTAFQYTIGTFMLISCGLHHAIDEALHHIRTGQKGDDFIESEQIGAFS